MVKKKSKKTELKELDDMWVKKVKDRDNWCCQVCHKKVVGRNCNAHHIIPKGVKGMRWDINNGITLCVQHHKFGNYGAHMNALWFTYWLKSNKLEQYRYCIKQLEKLNKMGPLV